MKFNDWMKDRYGYDWISYEKVLLKEVKDGKFTWDDYDDEYYGLMSNYIQDAMEGKI